MDFERVYAAAVSAHGSPGAAPSEGPLFPFEKRIALRNCGRIDPTDINDYIRRGRGYGGLARCLRMNPAAAFAETGGNSEWQAYAEAADNEKYVVCNAVDADPLARTARLLLESDLHAVLEGMLIAAYAVGASRCFVCVADEYRTAIERIDAAIAQMREYSLLGGRILDSEFSAEIEVRPVNRSLVLDEETALLCALEGKPPMPYLRTGALRLSGKPALIDDAEAFARISAITNGYGEFPPTRVITVAGAHQYTVEVPTSTSLRTLVAEIAGGKDVKAVQFGGPAGTFYDEKSLDTLIGDMDGSGTLKLFNANSCAVEMARNAATYLQEQSCGKCVFCRESTYQMSIILKDIAEGRGKPSDLDLLVELGEAMKSGSICDLGSRAADPVLSSIRLFRSEFESHITQKRCTVRQG